ncbi:MAG TPA: hypothetical protein VIC26_02010 [Marinagarivorans sp.]
MTLWVRIEAITIIAVTYVINTDGCQIVLAWCIIALLCFLLVRF